MQVKLCDFCKTNLDNAGSGAGVCIYICGKCSINGATEYYLEKERVRLLTEGKQEEAESCNSDILKWVKGNQKKLWNDGGAELYYIDPRELIEFLEHRETPCK